MISFDGVSLSADSVAALTNTSMSPNVRQMHELDDGIDYYLTVLDNLCKHQLHHGTSQSRGKYLFTPIMETVVRQILHHLAKPPILVFPNWEAVADSSRPFRLYCDASHDGLGDNLEQ